MEAEAALVAGFAALGAWPIADTRAVIEPLAKQSALAVVDLVRLTGVTRADDLPKLEVIQLFEFVVCHGAPSVNGRPKDSPLRYTQKKGARRTRRQAPGLAKQVKWPPRPLP